MDINTYPSYNFASFENPNGDWLMTPHGVKFAWVVKPIAYQYAQNIFRVTVMHDVVDKKYLAIFLPSELQMVLAEKMTSNIYLILSSMKHAIEKEYARNLSAYEDNLQQTIDEMLIDTYQDDVH